MTVDVRSLSRTKQKLLAEYLRGELPIQPAELTIRPMPSAERPPLSLAQEQLWQHSLATATPLYNESITIQRHGPLKIAVLERSLAEIIRRHEIWRTSYDICAGRPYQMIHPAPSVFPLSVVDLRLAPESERQNLALRCANEDAKRPFDLGAGPLLRATLIQMGTEDFRLALTAHLSIVDGVSVYQIFPHELSELYRAYSAGQSSPLPELAIQYRDFAYWQREWLIHREIPRQLGYWRTQLGGELPVLDWPRLRRPPVQTFRGALHHFTFAPQLLTSIKTFCDGTGFTLFTVLQAGFAALLHRYTKQTEIIVGTFSPAGRKWSAVLPLLGHFLNPVPLRLRFSDDPSFSDLLQRAQLTTAEALSHDDVPLEFVARELLPVIDPSRHPFFTVGISLQPLSTGNGSWYVTSMDAESGGGMWDLYLAFIERPAKLVGRIQYNPDLFSVTTIAKVVRDLSALLISALMNPERQVSCLSPQA